MGRQPFRLVLYTRPECHLCAVAAPKVRRAAFVTGAAVWEVNVDDDPELAVDYGMRIPVVEGPGGAVLAEGEINGLRLWAALIRMRWRRDSGK